MLDEGILKIAVLLFLYSFAISVMGQCSSLNPSRTLHFRKINLITLCGDSKGFIKAFKAFIKPFEAPQGDAKIKIQVNFLPSSVIGPGRVNLFNLSAHLITTQ